MALDNTELKEYEKGGFDGCGLYISILTIFGLIYTVFTITLEKAMQNFIMPALFFICITLVPGFIIYLLSSKSRKKEKLEKLEKEKIELEEKNKILEIEKKTYEKSEVIELFNNYYLKTPETERQKKAIENDNLNNISDKVITKKIKTRFKEQLKEFLLNGTVNIYTKGILEEKQFYLDGIIVNRTHYFKGVISYKNIYVNGKYDSQIHYNKEGKLKNGREIKYYDSGNIQSLANYRDGILCGEVELYYDISAVNGEAAIECKYWYNNGKPDIRAKFYLENGLCEKEILYKDRGNVEQISYEIDGYVEYYKNGIKVEDPY
jgi:antitoxin component YwqK of YwqJK toxin-antitoxin module